MDFEQLKIESDCVFPPWRRDGVQSVHCSVFGRCLGTRAMSESLVHLRALSIPSAHAAFLA